MDIEIMRTLKANQAKNDSLKAKKHLYVLGKIK